MRLIDADEIGLTDFEIVMCNGDYKEALKMLLDKISNQPTAYSVENVVEELETDSSVKLYGSGNSDNYIIPVKSAIEIVKQGGLDDDVCEWKGKEKEYIQNPHTKRLYSNEESMKNCYCNTCGKKIKVVE